MNNTIGIRPVEYWPGLAYLAHIASVKQFVLADTFQYSRQSFQNRARLRTPQGTQWISIPLVGGQSGKAAFQVRVERDVRYLDKHWRSLEFNYRSTAYFEYYESELYPLFTEYPTVLTELTTGTVRVLCRLFGINTELVRASELPEQPTTIAHIAATFPDRTVVSAEETLRRDPSTSTDAPVVRYEHPVYRQNFAGFEPGMSALDLLFNYGPAALEIFRSGIRL